MSNDWDDMPYTIFATAAPGWISYGSAMVAVVALLLTVSRLVAEFPKLKLLQEPVVDKSGAPLDVANYHDGIVVDTNGQKRQYVRARVRNTSLIGMARGTEVLAYIRATSDKPKSYPGLDVRPLRWASAEYRGTRRPMLDIPAGVERHIDLVVCEPDPRAAGKRRARVRVAREPSGEGHLLPENQEIPIFLVVACDGRRAAAFVTHVLFDGENIQVTKPPRRRKWSERHPKWRLPNASDQVSRGAVTT
jgi:hypothetical protein